MYLIYTHILIIRLIKKKQITALGNNCNTGVKRVAAADSPSVSTDLPHTFNVGMYTCVKLGICSDVICGLLVADETEFFVLFFVVSPTSYLVWS